MDLALMVGIEIPIPELQMVIHPPTIRDIAYMGEPDFFAAMSYLCLDKEALVQDKSLVSNMTNFQVLMKVLQQKGNASKKIAIQTLLTMLFPDYKVAMMPNSIIFTRQDFPPVMVDDSNFDILQGAIKRVLCASNVFQGKHIVYNPSNAAAKRIADKIAQGRRKVAELKAKQEGDSSMLSRYISILSIGAGISGMADFTLYQLFDLMERYSAYVEWDVDLRVKLAGGKPEKQVETWMRNLY